MCSVFPVPLVLTGKPIAEIFYMIHRGGRKRRETKSKRGRPNSKFGEGIGNNKLSTTSTRQPMTWQHQTRRFGLVVAVFVCAACFGHREGSLPEVELLDRYIFCETQTLKCMLWQSPRPLFTRIASYSLALLRTTSHSFALLCSCALVFYDSRIFLSFFFPHQRMGRCNSRLRCSNVLWWLDAPNPLASQAQCSKACCVAQAVRFSTPLSIWPFRRLELERRKKKIWE